MELTTKQAQGLKIAVERYANKEKFTVISGYAGTGKTTLVRFIIEALDISEDDICYAAFTGKAAEVLRKKGNKNVSTLHKLLYDSFPLPDGRFLRKPKINIDYKLVIVDEVSMAPKQIMELLFKHKCHVICLGDPFQLPPIDKDSDNGLLKKPHIFLDEIMRQEAESEIVQLSMKIRMQKPIEYFIGKEVQVIKSNELNTGMLTWADQILTATNKTRKAINNQMRMLYGREGGPQDGDKVICLRNYWNNGSENEDAPLVNGTIGTLRNSYQDFRKVPYFVKCPKRTLDVLNADLVVDNDYYKNIPMDLHMILTGEKCVDARVAYQLGKLFSKYGEICPKEFEYGYAITTHRAQGSEWDKVLVIEEKFPFAQEEHARWLYTAVTRASEKLVLVR